MNLYYVLAGQGTTHFERLFSKRFAVGGKTQTLTDVPPLSFKANGKPLVSWSMLGNGKQNGTPTPDAPIIPQFVGVRTVNVCPSAAAETKTNNGITAVCNGSGTYHVRGTATADSDIRFDVKSFLIPKSVGGSGSGTFSMFNSATYENTDVKIVFYYQSTKIDDWGLTQMNRTSHFYSTMGGKDCNAIGFTVKSGVTVDFTISPEFTDDGVLPTEFEPYGYKIPITCAGTTINVYTGDPLRKALDGSGAVDTLSSTGTITRKVDAEGNALTTPTTQIVDTPEIPTVKGQNTLTVETELQPSEMTITYKV